MKVRIERRECPPQTVYNTGTLDARRDRRASCNREPAVTQDEQKKAVAEAAIEFIPDDTIVGVGTGSTANYFIDALARIKGRIDGAVSSSEASASMK